MRKNFYENLTASLQNLKDIGLYKNERVITSQQSAQIKVASGVEVINFCANNYLGLANHPALIAEAKAAVEKYGFGSAVGIPLAFGKREISEDKVQELGN